jgi:hypothetical protein
MYKSIDSTKYFISYIVYTSGFLFMLFQFFVNYKLKSAAHFSWKALMYEACSMIGWGNSVQLHK